MAFFRGLTPPAILCAALRASRIGHFEYYRPGELTLQGCSHQHTNGGWALTYAVVALALLGLLPKRQKPSCWRKVRIIYFMPQPPLDGIVKVIGL